MKNKIKLQLIETLVLRAKKNDREAIKQLLKLFNPLICKLSQQIYIRYGKIFPIENIIRQSRCALVFLTVIHYIPKGKARYPYFIKKALHAHLVQLYRPIYTYAIKSIPLEKVNLPVPTQSAENGERHEIYDQLIIYINKNFNDREKDLIFSCFCGDTSRNKLAIKYRISYIRMKVIHQRVTKKLRKFLASLGINSMEEI